MANIYGKNSTVIWLSTMTVYWHWGSESTSADNSNVNKSVRFILLLTWLMIHWQQTRNAERKSNHCVVHLGHRFVVAETENRFTLWTVTPELVLIIVVVIIVIVVDIVCIVRSHPRTEALNIFSLATDHTLEMSYFSLESMLIRWFCLPNGMPIALATMQFTPNTFAHGQGSRIKTASRTNWKPFQVFI